MHMLLCRHVVRFLSLAVVAVSASAALAEEKFIPLEPMQERMGISVNADGSRVTLTGNDYLVFNEKGEQLKTVGIFHWGTGVIRMAPLADGRAISCTKGLNPHVDMMRADGSTMATLISNGWDDKSLHGDINWSSPHDMAVDVKAQRIFVVEETHPDNSGGGKTPDPQWVRVGMWDFTGKHLGDLYRYDAKAAGAAGQDAKRIDLAHIAVDPDRQRVYVTYVDNIHNRGTGMMALDYSGRTLAQTKIGFAWDNGSIAVLPSGNVVCSYGGDQQIQVFSADLKPLAPIKFPSKYVKDGGGPRVRQFAVDGQGRLYASVASPEVVFMRWSADFRSTDVFTIKHLWVRASPPDAAEAGKPFVIPAAASGDPKPDGKEWTVMARRSDGGDLRWRRLGATYDGAQLTVAAPDDFSGLYDVVVRYGRGEIVESNRGNDPFVKRMIVFVPKKAVRSVAAITANGRRAFRQGEAIPLQVVCHGGVTKRATVTLRLLDDRGAVVRSAVVPVTGLAAVEMPAALTGRLLPGSYTLAAVADGYAAYPLRLDIAPGYVDSPMQRILYQEYGFTGVSGARGYPDAPQGMNYLRDYFKAVHDWGFTRITDRILLNSCHGNIRAWRRDDLGLDLSNPALAPVEYYDVLRRGYEQENDFYLDRAVANGIVHDSHLANHCEALRFRDFWLKQKDCDLQRFVQWASKYPAHYGVNYHDEGFWGAWDSSWNKEDEDWLARAKARLGSQNEAWRFALDTGYESYNRAVHEVNPASKVTCTPTWQCGLSDGTYPPTNFKRMSESFTHYLGEGTQQPWYVLHSLESFRRPGLPLMGVVDNAHHGSGGEIVMKNMMLSLSRGVQGVGISFTAPLDAPGANEDAPGADVYHVVNRLAKWYGPILAQTTPVNEAAVLYSTTQSGTEKTQGWDSRHWGSVYGMLAGLMMAGVQANIVYEEDVQAGWLLAGGKPRYPMLFLTGQKAPLPATVNEAMRKYAAAGGRIFVDADSAKVPGATKLSFTAYFPAGEGFANDSVYVTMSPKLEIFAEKLKKAVAQYRGFPLDTDDPWISRGVFDGGDVRYLMLAAETRPYPWYGGAGYGFGQTYTRTVQPRTVAMTYPAAPGIVYDVFDHQIVEPQQRAEKARLDVNLRQFSGRLYALAPEQLAAPALAARLRGDQLSLGVQAMGKSGRPIAAQVPLRIRLYNDRAVAVEQYRGTSRNGVHQDVLTVPPGTWTLEVTELLGGNATTGTCTVTAPLAELCAARPEIETFRQDQLTQLLAAAKTGGLTLVLPSKDLLTAKQIAALRSALAARGITLATEKALPSEPQSGVLLAAGYPSTGNTLGTLLETTRNMGLAPALVSPNVPGPGRGFISPVYAPRGYGENVIALVGGDAAGLSKTVQAFCNRLAGVDAGFATPTGDLAATDVGVPCRAATATAALPRLADMVGPRLSAIATCRNSPYLAVAASGFGKNLALVKDLGSSAQVVSAQRVGASPRSDSLYVSPDGRYAGLSARELARCGEAFHLLDAGKQTQTVFAAFGDLASRYHHFAASSDGNYVIAVGTYGVACWKRQGDGWKEAWADEYWKSFGKLTWPISDTDERIPTFHAYIPEGADYVLVVFSETADNGWVTPDHHYKASLAAHGLADGRQRWRFEIPIPDAQLFPSLFASQDGRNLLVKVQNGSWNAVSYSFYSVDAAAGALKGAARTSKDAPILLAVGNGEGVVAAAYAGRNIEVRGGNGAMLFNCLWSGADPVSLAFSGDGKQLYVADDAGRLTCVGLDGEPIWRATVGAVAQLAVSGTRIYTAGWDGRVRAFAAGGALCWTLDCTAAMDSIDPLGEIATASRQPETVIAVKRPSSASPDVPPGEDLVAAGLATVSGAKIEGEVVSALQSGKPIDTGKPLISPQQLMQDIFTGQQAVIMIEFPKLTDVGALTVYENTKHPESYPTDSFIGAWDDINKQWVTVTRGVFLNGPANTYAVNLKAVKKLIYCPWNNYGNNFYTAKIEVRLPNAQDGYEQDFDKLAAGAIDGQDFWQGGSDDTVAPNPVGGQVLKVRKQAQRPSIFSRNPAFVKQVATFDFMYPRTINDPAFAVSQGVKQFYAGSFALWGPDPNQEFRFGYEGARNPKEAWINALRLGNTFGPNTIAPAVWYHARIVLDRQGGSFDLTVTEKATGKLYWHPAPVSCGKLNADQRGMNLLQINTPGDASGKNGVFIDNVKVTVTKK